MAAVNLMAQELRWTVRLVYIATQLWTVKTTLQDDCHKREYLILERAE